MLIYVTCEHTDKVFDSNTCWNAREQTAGEAGKKKKILVKWWEFQGDWLIIYTVNGATPACKKEKVELVGGGKE